MIVNALNSVSLEVNADPTTTFRVHYWGQITGHRAHSLHKHSYFECCYVTNGKGIYVENGARHELSRGDCFLSRPGHWHQIESEAGIDLIWVSFYLQEGASEEIAGKYRRLLTTGRLTLSSMSPSVTASLWQTLFDAGDKYVFDGLLRNLALSLILSFFQSFLKEEEESKLPQLKSSESLILHKAKLFIQDNLSQSLKFSDLAIHLHVSERHLSRLMKKQLGESFGTYLRKVKIKSAIQLLEMKDLSLKQIAAVTGFQSIHHFTRTFKLETGVAPGQWRKDRMSEKI